MTGSRKLVIETSLVAKGEVSMGLGMRKRTWYRKTTCEVVTGEAKKTPKGRTMVHFNHIIAHPIQG
jgi:hypothetical protein